jgi:transcriptional regulator with XRE-family HTH domain
MTVEFGKNFQAHREAFRKKTGSPSLKYEASLVGTTDGFLVDIQKGTTNVKQPMAVRLAEGLQIPLEERAKFYLLGAGFPLEYVESTLNTPLGICLSSASPEADITLGRLIETYKNPDMSYEELGDQCGIDSSYLRRVKNGKKVLQGWDLARSLVTTLNVPSERRAEFLLLARGHSYTEVHEILKAMGGIIQEQDVRETPSPGKSPRPEQSWRVLANNLETQFGAPANVLLERLYCQEGKSSHEIARMLGLENHMNVLRIMRGLGIRHRSKKEAMVLLWSDEDFKIAQQKEMQEGLKCKKERSAEN